MKICPYCGYDVERDESRVQIPGLTVYKDKNPIHDGKEIKLTRAEIEVLYAVVACPGIATVAVADRVGGSDNSMPVHLSRIRSKFKKAGAPCDLRTTRGTLNFSMVGCE